MCSGPATPSPLAHLEQNSVTPRVHHRGHGTRTTDRRRRRLLPRDEPGRREADHVLLRPGSHRVRPVARGRPRAIRSGRSRVLSDDEPFPSARALPHRWPLGLHAPRRFDVRPTRERACRARRATVSWALPIDRRARRSAAVGHDAIHPPQCARSTWRRCSRAVSLVESSDVPRLSSTARLDAHRRRDVAFRRRARIRRLRLRRPVAREGRSERGRSRSRRRGRVTCGRACARRVLRPAFLGAAGGRSDPAGAVRNPPARC